MPITEVVAVPFHGDTILTVDVGGRPHIVLKPAVEALDLDYWAQVRKLRSRSWATTASEAVVAADGKTREMLVVDVRTFLMLLATVDEHRVAESVAPKLITYQAEVADAIEAYWTRGVAVRPEPRVPAPRDPDRYDFLRAMLDQIEAAEQQAARAEQVAIESARTSLDTSARLDAIEGRHDWYAALGYAKLHGLPTSRTWLALLGREASAVGHEHGIEVNKVQHAHFGLVNQWPVWVWDEAVARRRAA